MGQKPDEPDAVNRRFGTLIEFGKDLASASHSGEPEILELIHDHASRLMDANNMCITLYDESKGTSRVGFAILEGEYVHIDKNAGWQPPQDVEDRIQEVFDSRKPLLHATEAEAQTWYSHLRHGEHYGEVSPSWLSVPMAVGESLIGVIAVYHPTQDQVYDVDDLEILQALANQAAVAIRAAKVYENLQQEQARRIAGDKFVYLGQAVDGLAHRINNTIALLPLCVRDIRRHLETVDSYIDSQLSMIDRNSRYILELAEALQKPSRPAELGHFDINLLLEDSIRAANIPSDVEVVAAFDENLPTVETPRLLVDVFVELITNAAAAMSESEVKKLEIGSRHFGTEFVEVWFTDTGRGIPKESRDRIFELFYTSKKFTESVGKGFGLWWARTFLASQGGEIAVDSAPGEGATFRVRLPLRKQAIP